MDVKKKCSNFTKAEIDVLVDEVEQRRNVLFGKLSMNLTSDMKREGWNKVAEKVSEVSGSEVGGAKAVKKKWSDMSSSLKRKEAGRRRQMNKTGGGQSESGGVGEDLLGVEQRVVGMLAVEAIDGVEGGVDVGIEGVQKEKVDSKEKAQISAKRDVVAVGNGGMDEVLAVEKKRLAVEEERLEIEKKRLAVEESRLKMEEERLNLERSRWFFEPALARPFFCDE